MLQCEHVPRATASLAKALHQGCCAACRWAQRHRQHDAQPVSRELGWDETQLVEQRATPCAPQATRSCAAGGCCTSVQHLAGLLHGATPPIRGGCGTSVQHPAPHGRLLYLRAATPLGRGFWTERPATSPPRGGLLCEVSVAGRSLQPRARAHTHTDCGASWWAPSSTTNRSTRPCRSSRRTRSPRKMMTWMRVPPCRCRCPRRCKEW